MSQVRSLFWACFSGEKLWYGGVAESGLLHWFAKSARVKPPSVQIRFPPLCAVSSVVERRSPKPVVGSSNLSLRARRVGRVRFIASVLKTEGVNSSREFKSLTLLLEVWQSGLLRDLGKVVGLIAPGSSNLPTSSRGGFPPFTCGASRAILESVNTSN